MKKDTDMYVRDDTVYGEGGLNEAIHVGEACTSLLRYEDTSVIFGMSVDYNWRKE